MVGRRPEHAPEAMVVYAVSTLTLLGAAGIAPVIPVLTRAFSLTAAQAGLVMTAYTLPVVVAVPVVGWLADRVGRRPPLLAGLVTFGLAGAATFFAPDFRTVLALRLLQGVGYSAISPLTIALIGDLFEGADEAGAQGLRVVAVNLGGFAFPVAMGALAAIAWNVPFLLFILAIPAGLAVRAWLPAAPAGRGASGRRRADRWHGRAVLRAVRTPIVAGALAIGFSRFFVSYGVYTYLPFLVAANAIEVGTVGVVIGSISGAKILVAAQARRTFDLGRQGLVMSGALLAGGLLVATFAAASTFAAFLAVAVAYGLGEGVIAPLQKSALTQHTPADVRASVVSLNAVLKNTGKTAAPVAVGVAVSARGLETAFLALGAAGAVVATLLVLAFAFGSRARAPA